MQKETLPLYCFRFCDKRHQGGSSRIWNLLQNEIPQGFNHHNSLGCAGFIPGGRSTCFGDSGGPILLTRYTSPSDKSKVLHYVQVGVVQGSYNINCKSSGQNSDYPVIFNRLEQKDILRFIHRVTDLSGLYKKLQTKLNKIN